MAVGLAVWRVALPALLRAHVRAASVASVGLLELPLAPRSPHEAQLLARASAAVERRLYVRLAGDWAALGWHGCHERLATVYAAAERPFGPDVRVLLPPMRAAAGASRGVAHPLRTGGANASRPGGAADAAAGLRLDDALCGAPDLEALLCCEPAASAEAPDGPVARLRALNTARRAAGLGEVRSARLPATPREQAAAAAACATAEAASGGGAEAQRDLPLRAYGRVCVGGTFDRLHCGHKLLLSAAALGCARTLTVGLSARGLLAHKALGELVEPMGARACAVRQFLASVCPGLAVELTALTDASGPAASRADLDAIAFTGETSAGAEAIGRARAEARLAPLAALRAAVLDCPAHAGAGAGAGAAGAEAASAASPPALPAAKVSSTGLRRSQLARLLPAQPLMPAGPPPAALRWAAFPSVGAAEAGAPPATEPGGAAEPGGGAAVAAREVAYGEWARRSPRSGAYVIGLTGGIASGKSTAAAFLRDGLGCSYVDCDRLGHSAYLPGTEAHAQLAAEFGGRVLNAADGTVDRSALGALVFADGEKRARLQQIVWPQIARMAQQALGEARAGGVAVVEAAVLLEAGWDGWVDEVWALSAPRALAIERIRRRDGRSADEAAARIGAQASAEARAARAHVLLSSEWDADELRAQVARALDGARARARVGAGGGASVGGGSGAPTVRERWSALCVALGAPEPLARSWWRALYDAHVARCGEASAGAARAERTLGRLRALLALAELQLGEEGADGGLSGGADLATRRSALALALIFESVAAAPRSPAGGAVGAADGAGAAEGGARCEAVSLLRRFVAEAAVAPAAGERGSASAAPAPELAAVGFAAEAALLALHARRSPGGAAAPGAAGNEGRGAAADVCALLLDLERAPLGALPPAYFALADGAEYELSVAGGGRAAAPGPAAADGSDDAAELRASAGAVLARRAEVERLLAEPRLYATERLHAALDGAARENLRAELGRLRAQTIAPA